MGTIIHLNELCCDPKRIAVLADTSFQHGLNIEDFGDLGDSFVSTSEGKGRGPRRYLQALNSSQRV